MRYFYLFLLSLLIACAQAPQKETPLPPQLANPYLKQPSEKAVYTPVKKITLADGLSSNNIQKIFKDSKGFLWIGTSNGLNRYDGLTIKNYWHDSDDANSILHNNIIDIAEDSLGNILILTQKGVNWIQPNQVILTYTQPNWLLFFYKHKTRAIFTVMQDEDYKTSFEFRFAKDSKNDFWQIEDHKISKIDTNLRFKGLIPTFAEGFSSLPSVTIHKNDSIGFQPRNNETVTIDCQDSLGLNGIEALIADTTQFLVGWDDFKYLLAPENLNPNHLLLEQNTIWIGTNKGVFQYSKGTTLFETALHTDSIGIRDENEPLQNLDSLRFENEGYTVFEDTPLRATFEDSKKRFWIGTDIGLYRMDTTTRIRYAQNAGFQHPEISEINEDSHGQLWISTDGGGIAVFSPKLGQVVRTFTEEDGLPTRHFYAEETGDKIFRQMIKGHFDFHFSSEGESAYTNFNPDSLYRNAQPPTVVITDVTANEVEKRSADPHNYTFTLPYDSNSLILTPRVLSLTQPHRNKIRYKLEGVDANYCKPLAVKDLHYPHLAAGEYTLLIQGANNHGVWNPQPTRCYIKILPAWWQTWWFRLLVGGLMIVLSSRFFYMRQRHTNQKHQRETDALQARVLQAQLNPHFIFNVLTLVQSKIMNEVPQDASDLLVRLSKLLRNFLESSILSSHESGQFQEIELEKEIELLTEYIDFERLKNDCRFEYHLNIAPNIEPSNEKLPPFFIQPYVENAIKHGLLYRNDDQGILTITFDKKVEQGDSYLVCTVSDNGVGRSQAQVLQNKDKKLHKSRGTELIENRLKILNSYKYAIQIDTYDNEPSGTKVVIQFKYKS